MSPGTSGSGMNRPDSNTLRDCFLVFAGWFLWALVFVMVALVGSLAGCVNPQFPRDSIVIKGESKVSTPWGSAQVSAEEIRTGKAAVPSVK